MRTIGIFAGSSDESITFFKEEVERLGEMLVREGYRIVYGAGRIGLMGVLAQKVHTLGGNLVGVVPKYLHRDELVFNLCSELIVTEDLHERKEIMESISDAFVVLPGGIGTLDEFFNVLATRQLKYHHKPIYLLNLCDFFKPLEELFQSMLRFRFIREEHVQLFSFKRGVEDLVHDLNRHFSAITVN